MGYNRRSLRLAWQWHPPPGGLTYWRGRQPTQGARHALFNTLAWYGILISYPYRYCLRHSLICPGFLSLVATRLQTSDNCRVPACLFGPQRGWATSWIMPMAIASLYLRGTSSTRPFL